MELTLSEQQSAAWRTVKAHLEMKLAAQRLRLEGPLDLDETNRVRGRIAELKSCLGLERPNESPVA